MQITKELYGAEEVAEEINTGMIRNYDGVKWRDKKDIERIKHEAKYRKTIIARMQACGRNSGKLGEMRRRGRGTYSSVVIQQR